MLLISRIFIRRIFECPDTKFRISIAKLGDAVRHFQRQPPQGERGARYVYMETGALAQNVHLQSTALGVGCVLVAGFDDSRVKEALRLPADLEPTALLCIGQRRDV